MVSGNLKTGNAADTPASSGEPFFTVIIPTYNRADLVGRSIESVIRQTYPCWELIIVDDGSTDNTSSVVKAYNDPRIRYIYQPCQERSAARNNGIRNSKGRYICFLDSDDYYLPEHLASFHKKIVSENYPVAVLYCDTMEDCGGRLTRMIIPEVDARNPVEWVMQLPLGAPRTCVHKSIFARHQFNPGITVGEDVDLWVRVLKEFPAIYNKDCTVVFVTHQGRTVAIGKEDSFKAHLSLMRRLIAEDKGGFISKKARRRVLSNAWFRLGQHYDYSGKKIQAFAAFLRALFIDPSSRVKEKVYMMIRQLGIV